MLNDTAFCMVYRRLKPICFCIQFISTITWIYYKQSFFSTQPQCCLTFSWIQLHMMLRYCLLHGTIIILRQILNLVYLCPCIYLFLLVSNLCDQFLIIIFIFIEVNNIIITQKDTRFLCTFFRISHISLNGNMNKEIEQLYFLPVLVWCCP